MIEKTIIEYLESKLLVSVYAETPVDVPEKYIVIQKLGGSMTNRIFNSQIAVQSISSTSLYDAAELNDDVVSNMIDIIDETGGIAIVANTLAFKGINIKNIGIIHNREFEQGVLRVEFYDHDTLESATKVLKDKNYAVYSRK